MKSLLLCSLALLVSVTARSAPAPQQLPTVLQGNWNTVDGGQQWMYGLHPTVAVWQNAFWDYDGISTKGAVTTIRLRERGGERTATLYARWNSKDSTAMIGLSPKKLTPYSRRQIANPNYRIPAAEDIDYPGGDSILHNGVAVVRGYLDGYKPETMPRTIKIYTSNTFMFEDFPVVGDIAADGTFEVTVPVSHPLMTDINLSQVFYDYLYIEPGDTLMVGYNFSGKGSVWFMGTNGRVNREMSALHGLYAPFEGEDPMFVMRTTPDSIRNWVGERIARDSAATAKYIAENGISRKGAFLARWTPYVIGYETLGLYASYHREEKNPVDTSFFDFYRRLPMEDPRLLGTRNYDMLINRLEFCRVYWGRPRWMGCRDLLRAGFEIAPEDMSRFDSLERKLYTVPGDSAATARAIQTANKKLDKYVLCFYILNVMQRIDHIYAAGDAYWGRPMPFLNDLLAARRMLDNFSDHNKFFIPNRQWAQVLAHFSTPYIIETLLDANDALRPVPKAEAGAEEGPYVPADWGERLLDSLLRPHRGRVVYVDFWGLGCGPCRQGMMESWKIKEKLAGQPVDFVYITSTDQSPEKSAADFIEKNKITGRQIRLTPDEWNILAAKYRINGIPHYMIVGPDGRVVNPHYWGHHGDDIVRDLLKVVGE